MDIPENGINEILDNNPSQGTLHILLPALAKEGQYLRVIRECRKCLLRFPEDYEIRKILAEAYFAEGRLLEAEAEADCIIAGIEELSEIYRLKEDILATRNRKDDEAGSIRDDVSTFPEDNNGASVSPADITEEAVPEDTADIDSETADVPAEETEEFPEIITVTLAETYFEQERLEDAVDIYNKLIIKHPEDTAIRERLDELTALMHGEETGEEDNAQSSGIDEGREKKEKVIAILDTWRKNLREAAAKEVSQSQ